MEVISLDTNKKKVAIIDSYKSFIWNDRYEDLGDFELYIPADAVELLANIHNDYFIQCSESDRTMIVEKVDYKTDLEDGNFVTISGHSLEAILRRRIVWNDDGKPTYINATKIADPKSDAEDTGSDFPLYLGIHYLLRLYIMEPECADNKPQRKIPNFYFRMPADNDPIKDIMMSPCAYQGDNLYDVIRSICTAYEISFKILLEDGDFVFELYKGVSHLASQTENPYVCFSKDFDNLLSSDSSIDMSTYKNMAYFKGRGSKYVVDEFDDKEITMETGYIRIHNNSTWAVNMDYGVNEEMKPAPDEDEYKYPELRWTPDEFNAGYDPDDGDTVYPIYELGDTVSRTVYGGALVTEDGCCYLAAEPEEPEGGDTYSSILLYTWSFEEEEKYYECTEHHQGPWNPNHFKLIDIRVTWGDATSAGNTYYDEYKPGTEEEPEKHEEGDVVQYSGSNWTCIKEHESTGSFDDTKWVHTYTHDVTKIHLSADDKDHCLWTECKTWDSTKRNYKKGDFCTFDESGRTGKITIYRKTEKDAVYGNKKKYKKGNAVWYAKPNSKVYNMYYCKKTKMKNGQEVGIKGVLPTNTVWWRKLTNKYQIFSAQQWEALSDMDVEQYDITGAVQDSNVGGIDRREMFVDASSVPSTYNHFYNNDQEETIDWLVDDGIMQATVRDMALAELTIPANRMTKGLNAEIDYATNFKYREDYNIGDLVEVRDIYGYIDSVRVKEFIICHDDTGIKCYPSYEAVEASTITTRLLEVNDELLGNTFLVKIPQATRFISTQTIAVAVKDDTTYYLRSFLKKVTTENPFDKGKELKRDMHIVAWVTTDDIYENYEKQAEEDLLKSHPTLVGEPLFYADIDSETKKSLPAVLFPSWTAPYGTDLGIITEIDPTTDQYKNILLANI